MLLQGPCIRSGPRSPPQPLSVEPVPLLAVPMLPGPRSPPEPRRRSPAVAVLTAADVAEGLIGEHGARLVHSHSSSGARCFTWNGGPRGMTARGGARATGRGRSAGCARHRAQARNDVAGDHEHLDQTVPRGTQQTATGACDVTGGAKKELSRRSSAPPVRWDRGLAARTRAKGAREPARGRNSTRVARAPRGATGRRSAVGGRRSVRVQGGEPHAHAPSSVEVATPARSAVLATALPAPAAVRAALRARAVPSRGRVQARHSRRVLSHSRPALRRATAHPRGYPSERQQTTTRPATACR